MVYHYNNMSVIVITKVILYDYHTFIRLQVRLDNILQRIIIIDPGSLNSISRLYPRF